MNKGKILWTGIGLLLVALAVWFILSNSGSDSYNYQGYVVNVREDGKDTVLTTISGNTSSEFTIKWYTKEKYNEDAKSVQVGDHIKLSTTGSNSKNLKKFSVYAGYSIAGKIFYTEDSTTPMLLVQSKATKTYYVYSLIFDQAPVNDKGEPITLPVGSQINVFYSYPLMGGNNTIVTGAMQYTSDVIEPLTEDEIAYLTFLNYTLAET